MVYLILITAYCLLPTYLAAATPPERCRRGEIWNCGLRARACSRWVRAAAASPRLPAIIPAWKWSSASRVPRRKALLMASQAASYWPFLYSAHARVSWVWMSVRVAPAFCARVSARAEIPVVVGHEGGFLHVEVDAVDLVRLGNKIKQVILLLCLVSLALLGINIAQRRHILRQGHHVDRLLIIPGGLVQFASAARAGPSRPRRT